MPTHPLRLFSRYFTACFDCLKFLSVLRHLMPQICTRRFILGKTRKSERTTTVSVADLHYASGIPNKWNEDLKWTHRSEHLSYKGEVSSSLPTHPLRLFLATLQHVFIFVHWNFQFTNFLVHAHILSVIYATQSFVRALDHFPRPCTHFAANLRYAIIRLLFL